MSAQESGSPPEDEPGALRVAIVNKHPADGPGGSEVQCGLIAQGLVSRGHEVVYVAPHRVGRRPSAIHDGLAYEFVRVPQWGRSIASAVVDAGADVVYWRFNKRGLRSAMARLRRAKVPTVFAVAHVNDLGPWSAKPLRGGALRRHAGSVLLRLVSRWQHAGLRDVSAMTTNNIDLLLRLDAPMTAHVPNGMIADAEPFSWPRPYCLWVSGLKASKRPEAAVSLARDIRDTGVDVLMVGGVQERAYAWLSQGEGLPDNLHYLGVRSLQQVNGMFASAHLHVHTCLPEGFPNVFLQAWLQGCPSVSLGFDPGNVIERERLGADAGDDWTGFVEAVRTLLADDDRRRVTGERARAHARREHDVEAMVARVEKLLGSVAGTTERQDRRRPT